MRMTFVSLAAAVLLLGTGAAHASDQVNWDTVSPIAPWYSNHEFTSTLNRSLIDFFGNAVGMYFTKPTDTPTGQAKAFAEDTQWHLISSQFYGPPGMHIDPRKGTILNGQWEIYAYEQEDDGAPISAFVTPINSTKVVAAMIVHVHCAAPHLSAHAMTDRAKVQANFHQCESRSTYPPIGMVTVFFKNKFSVNPQIRDALLAYATKPSVKLCRAGVTAMYAPEPVPRAIAKRCRMRWKVKLLDQQQ
ncbi:MAG TPA: hypothetical protein VFQ95_02310 [Rhodanobacteraceae bacterium]|nr:hypothetical protein [Rhodanobacteraceae bacterium]